MGIIILELLLVFQCLIDMAFKRIKVIEMAGLAPAPMCGMILSDFGASVIQISKPNDIQDHDCLHSGKKRICVDMKHELGQSIIKNLVKSADILIDPFRPGIMEKYSLGPSELKKVNSRLIFARLSGYGQSGPKKMSAGHDINYLAMSGVFSMLGRKNDNPHPPINLTADFAGGGLMCAFGISMALFARESSGVGQVIDCSMVEGAAYVGQWLWRSQNLFIWGKPKGNNLLDGGVHFYDTYETKDHKFMAVGAIEPKFYDNFVSGLGSTVEEIPQFGDFDKLKNIVSTIFLSKSQKEWCDIFENSDACVTPVLSLTEAAQDEHNKYRNSFITSHENVAPQPAPKLSLNPGVTKLDDYTLPGLHTYQVLQSYGYGKEELDNLNNNGVI